MALQVMFMESNMKHACAINEIVRETNLDEVQINTPLRPCAIDALGREELARIKNLFTGLNVISAYESMKKYVTPISDEDTLKRRGKT